MTVRKEDNDEVLLEECTDLARIVYGSDVAVLVTCTRSGAYRAEVNREPSRFYSPENAFVSPAAILARTGSTKKAALAALRTELVSP